MIEQVEADPRTRDQHNLWNHFYTNERICQLASTLDLAEAVRPDHVRFVCVSDTHNKMGQLLPKIPAEDVFIHCGDFTNFGDTDELDQFNEDLAKLPHKYKVVIAGNHELGFEDGEDVSKRIADKAMWEMGSGERGTPMGYKRLTDCIYLHDSSIKIYGLTIYGTSWHPLPGFSFHRPRGESILKEWLKIPPAEIMPDGSVRPRVDVLLTHTPPLGHSDIYEMRERWGDGDLLNCIEKRIKPRVHVFGHVHEQPYATTNGETLFINAAICGHGRFVDGKSIIEIKNDPMIFDLPLPQNITKE